MKADLLKTLCDFRCINEAACALPHSHPTPPPHLAVADVEYTSDAKVFAAKFTRRVEVAIPTAVSVAVQRLFAADNLRRALLEEKAELGVEFAGALYTCGASLSRCQDCPYSCSHGGVTACSALRNMLVHSSICVTPSTHAL